MKDKSSPSSDEVGYSSIEEGQLKKVTRISSITTVIVAGLALFSDGYNAQIIGYMKPLFGVLYKKGFTDSISTRLSNSCMSFSISLAGYVLWQLIVHSTRLDRRDLWDAIFWLYHRQDWSPNRNRVRHAVSHTWYRSGNSSPRIRMCWFVVLDINIQANLGQSELGLFWMM